MINSLIHTLEGKSKILIISLSIASAVLLGLIDYLTGFEISFAFFYTFPVALAAWGAGLGAGVVVSILCAILWGTANQLAGETYPNFWIPFWNSLTRFGFFIVITFLVGELHRILNEEKMLARTDDLTRALNRRAFYEAVNYELDRARRYPNPLTMVYFDLDGFKVVNDEKGHIEGDRLLFTVSAVINKQIRTVDILGRLGGDEFAILLPQTDQMASQLVIPRLQQALSDCMLENNWPVTFSIGVLSCFDIPDSAEDLVFFTDHLMYEVKNNGKNAVKYAVFHK